MPLNKETKPNQSFLKKEKVKSKNEKKKKNILIFLIKKKLISFFLV